MNFKKTKKILSASLAGLLILPGCCQAKKVEVQENHKIADLKSSKAAEQNSFGGRIKKLLFWSSIIGGSMLAGGAIDKYLLQNKKSPAPDNEGSKNMSTAPTPLFTDVKKDLTIEKTKYGYKIETPLATIALFKLNQTTSSLRSLSMMFQLKRGASSIVNHNPSLLENVTHFIRLSNDYSSHNNFAKPNDSKEINDILMTLCGNMLYTDSFYKDYDLPTIVCDSLSAFSTEFEVTNNRAQYLSLALKFGLTDMSENLKFLTDNIELWKSCALPDHTFNRVDHLLDQAINPLSEDIASNVRYHVNVFTPTRPTTPLEIQPVGTRILQSLNTNISKKFYSTSINISTLLYSYRATSAFNYILSDYARKTEITTIMEAYPERFNTLEADALCRYSDETALYKYLLDGKTIPKELKEKIK